MAWFRKKKEQKTKELVTGLVLGEERTAQQSRRFLTCLPKGLLCFFIIFGSFGGFLSAFEIECNYVIAALVLLASAVYFSFLFSFQKSSRKDLGYILFFIFYVFGILTFKVYVNSGFAGIINVIRQRGEVYFGLNTGTEFAEQIEDRNLSVTMTFIFVGVFLILTLNIFLSNYMNLKLPLFVCVPLYIIPLYFRQEPKLFFVFCLCGGFLGVHMLKNGRRHQVEKNARVYQGVLLTALAAVVLTGVFSLAFTEEKNREIYHENSYKKSTERAVSGFVMMGFWSFFPNPASRGGMSGGKLGDFSMLRPDNETDLKIRFAPYTTDPLYLKGYTGLHYEGNEWTDGYQMLGGTVGHTQYFYTESMKEEADVLAKRQKKNPQQEAKAKIEIENAGADADYVYYPYFTKFKDYKKYTNSSQKIYVANPIGTKNTFTFYPNLTKEAVIQDADSYIYHQVPDENTTVLDDCIRDMGLVPGKNYGTDSNVVNTVITYLHDNYTYSYRPGRVPEGEDFVNYFLEDNKKGVCMHFASAAALLLRRLGIATRYVEGYAVGYGDILKGTLREDLNYDDFYEGPSALGKTGVMEVELTDANAHAWVEAYFPNTGWQVVDATPTNMSENTDSDFWSSVKKLIDDSPQIQLGEAFSNFGTGLISSGIMPVAALVVAVAIILFFAGKRVYLSILRYRSWHTEDVAKNLLIYLEIRSRRWEKKDAAYAGLVMPGERLHYLAARDSELPFEETGVEELFERCCFSSYKPTPEEYKKLLNWIKKLT